MRRRGLIYSSTVGEAKQPSVVPSSTRAFLEAGKLPYFGLPPDRRTMTPAHQLELINRYPGLYRHAGNQPTNQAEPFAREGFSCGDGWFEIIDRLSAKLVEDPYLVVGQLKEKMGRLRVYLHSAEGTPPPDPALDARLDVAMEAAEEESKRTCELCGQPGVSLNPQNWVGVRCPFCAALDDLEATAPERAEATCGHLVEIRTSVRNGMAKLGRRARAIVFGAYELVDRDLELMLVFDHHEPGLLKEYSAIRGAIDLERGLEMYVVTADEFEERKDISGTPHHEAHSRGILLFDDLGDDLGD